MSIRGKIEVSFVGRVGSDREVEEVRVTGVDIKDVRNDSGVLSSSEVVRALRRAIANGTLDVAGVGGRR